MNKKHNFHALVACLLASIILLSSCNTSVPSDGTATTETVTDTQTNTPTETVTVPETDVTTNSTTDHSTTKEEKPSPAESVIFSEKGGVYTSAVTVELSASNGETIRYTTDGSVPTKTSKEYKEAITVQKDALTIRAARFDSGNMIGEVVTHTYVIRDSKASTLYTVMISANENDLKDMYASVHDTIERPAHVEIVTPDGETVISQDAGLRLFGGSSRGLKQKSFKIIARKTGYFGADAAYVGQGTFRYALFPERVVKAGKNEGEILDRYDSFILRNGGNDSLLHTACNPENATIIRDGLANNFAADVVKSLEYSYCQYAVVYLNGEYYGLLDMRENLNEDFVKRVWGVLDDEVVVIKSELDTSRHCNDHSNGSSCRYCNVWFYYDTDDNEIAQNTLKDWLKFSKEICSKVDAGEADYNAAFEKLEANVDLVSLKEWFALNLYLCNTDWPHNNIKLWKYTGVPIEDIEITDGKWRFMTRDMDMTMSRYGRPDISSDIDNRATVDTFWRTLGNYIPAYHNFYSNSGETRLYPDSLYLQGLFAFCMRNDAFRAEFEAYCRDLISEEKQQLLNEHYEALVAQVSSEVQNHVTRWQNVIGKKYTYNNWTRALGSITDFMENRPAKFVDYLNRCLSMYK